MVSSSLTDDSMRRKWRRSRDRGRAGNRSSHVSASGSKSPLVGVDECELTQSRFGGVRAKANRSRSPTVRSPLCPESDPPNAQHHRRCAAPAAACCGWAVQGRRWQAATPPQQRPPSLRRPRAWPRSRTPNDESAPPLGWQRNCGPINRSDNQRLQVWMCQLAGRFHSHKAGLLSRSKQQPLRVGQLRPLIEVQPHTVGTCGDRHDAIDPPIRGRIAEDDGVRVVVRQLVGGRESLTDNSPDRSNELLILRIKPVDEGPELGLRRTLPAIGFHCHRILPIVLTSSASVPPNGLRFSGGRSARAQTTQRLPQRPRGGLSGVGALGPFAPARCKRVFDSSALRSSTSARRPVDGANLPARIRARQHYQLCSDTVNRPSLKGAGDLRGGSDPRNIA